MRHFLGLCCIFFSNVVVLLVIAECNISRGVGYVVFFFSNVVVLLVIAECNTFSYVVFFLISFE